LIKWKEPKSKKKKKKKAKGKKLVSEPNRDASTDNTEELSDFGRWLVEKGYANKKSSALKKSKKKKKKKNKSKSDIHDLTKGEGVISEPLAALLADQGHNDKAIAMYQQLSLIFPEKSTYFASAIEKLKKKE